jgi:hypothetical protein
LFNPNEIRDPHATPTRVHYSWEQMEEYQPDGGMWAIPEPGARLGYIDATAELMCNPDAFSEAMRHALYVWPRSVSVALTTPGLNHRAWLGHAGCYLATGSPEETTRLGWHQLDDGEQFAANAAADRVIGEWRRANAPSTPEPEWLF